MDYRKAEEKDIHNLVELRKKQLIDEGQEPEIGIDEEARTFFTIHLPDDSLVEWLAIENGNIIATAGIVFFEFPPSFTNKSGIRGYVTNMYTVPEYRGRGIATKLLGKLMDEARERKVTMIFLGASKMGKPVYKQFGFTESDKWMELSL